MQIYENYKSSKQLYSTWSGAPEDYLRKYCEGYQASALEAEVQTPWYLENMRNYLNKPRLSAKRSP